MLLMTIAAPLLQYEGTSQGFLFDPVTLTPLMDNDGV